jgi:hypothetical protein
VLAVAGAAAFVGDLEARLGLLAAHVDAEDLAHRREERGRRHGLHHVAADPGGAALAGVLELRRGGQHHDGAIGDLRGGLAHELEAVDVADLRVEDDDVERLLLLARAGQPGLRALEVGGDLDVEAGFAEEVRDDFAGSGVVVDDEGAEGLEGVRRSADRGLRRAAEARREDEGAAAAGLALERDAAAHRLGHARRDGEAEAGAAVLAGGGAVDLREGVEDDVLLAFGDADAGVAHVERDVARRRRGSPPRGARARRSRRPP